MKQYFIPVFLFFSALFLTGCVSYQASCPNGGCGYVSTASYVTTSTCCTKPKPVIVKTTCCMTNCCPTCNRCGGDYGYSYGYDAGYGYGTYNTGWY